MERAKITATVGAKDKEEFELICKMIGLTTSEAINIYVKAFLRERGIPFRLELKPNTFSTDSLYLSGDSDEVVD